MSRRPKLSSKKEEDPEVMKLRLAEKAKVADANRARELLKVSAKLARQEEHARRVLERKRQLEDEEMRLSVGGENGGLAKLADSSSESQFGGSVSGSSGDDSASYLADANRGESGRSLLSDTTDTTSSDSPPESEKHANPLKTVQAAPGRVQARTLRMA
jgi:hypothetical protein